MDMDVASRVARGVAAQDQYRPGWLNKVNAETLNILSAANCLLGQTAGDFGAGLAALTKDMGLEPKHEVPNAWRLGLLGLGDSSFAIKVDSDRLTHEWKRVIGVLRQAKADEGTRVTAEATS